jgi:hypothetical protein
MREIHGMQTGTACRPIREACPRRGQGARTHHDGAEEEIELGRVELRPNVLDKRNQLQQPKDAYGAHTHTHTHTHTRIREEASAAPYARME